jgi:competence protein ComEC
MLLGFYLLLITFLKWTEKLNFNRSILLLFSIIALQSIFIFEKYQLQSTQNLIVFNKTAESMIATRLGEKLNIETSIPKATIKNNPLKNYLVGTGIDSVNILEKIENLQFFSNEKILVVDSLGVYNFNIFKPSIVILRQSPNINLDRLLKTLNPKLIIADGSNYKSDILCWEQSCDKNKTPFYSTMQNGAFMLD